MKSILKTSVLIITLLIAFSTTTLGGNKPFEGIITYKISYPDSDFDAQTMSMLPKVATVYIKDHMIKSEVSTGMGMQATIFNSKDKTSVSLLDMMGQKFAIHTGADQYDEELENYESEVDNTTETKIIAGYECKKAIVHVKDKKTGSSFDFTVYYTDELNTDNISTSNAMFKDIEGMMLEYEMEKNNMSMKFSAISVKKKNIKDKTFEIPEDYKETTKEEFQQNFGG